MKILKTFGIGKIGDFLGNSLVDHRIFKCLGTFGIFRIISGFCKIERVVLYLEYLIDLRELIFINLLGDLTDLGTFGDLDNLFFLLS